MAQKTIRMTQDLPSLLPHDSNPMTNNLIGQPLDALDTPQLLLDLDVIDGNLLRLFEEGKRRHIDVRVHFKSLKCAGLAKYIAARGGSRFLCAKLNEAEVLADAGLHDILIANEIVSPLKFPRLANLARRVRLRVCVDDADNVRALGQAMQQAGASLGILVEVDVGMNRCGVPPGEPALDLARIVQNTPGLRLDGLQGYDGHLQLLSDPSDKRTRAMEGLEQLVGTRLLLEKNGLACPLVTGAGTGTWEYAAGFPGMTEIQPGSFVLMDCVYHTVRPEFGCSLTILTTVISKRPTWYVLDAGSKAISKDFGDPAIKNYPQDKIPKLAEEHAKVLADATNVKIGERREVIPAHCCATMNLHRTAIAVRQGKVEAVWPIEASGRYD